VLFRANQTTSAIVAAVLIPSFIFGLFHLIDFGTERVSSEISQMIYATFIGVGFGAILLKTGSLIPLAILHGLINFVFGLDGLATPGGGVDISTANSSLVSAVASVVVTSPLLFIGLRITKKMRPSEIEIE